MTNSLFVSFTNNQLCLSKQKAESNLPNCCWQSGLGTPYRQLPTGNYKVIDIQPNPVWEHPWTGEVILEGQKNPLGERWISFWTDRRDSIGFHGIPEEELVGQAVSHGCIRMHNRDVVALHSQVKMGTPVTVKA